MYQVGRGCKGRDPIDFEFECVASLKLEASPLTVDIIHHGFLHIIIMAFLTFERSYRIRYFLCGLPGCGPRGPQRTIVWPLSATMDLIASLTRHPFVPHLYDQPQNSDAKRNIKPLRTYKPSCFRV
jgi:hypothetical protein